MELEGLGRSRGSLTAQNLRPTGPPAVFTGWVRRNSLFAGSAGGAQTWAILASLVNTAMLNGHDPFHWLHDVLERIVSGRTRIHQLDELLAWNWTPASSGLSA